MSAFTHPDDALRQNVEAGQDAALQNLSQKSEEVRQQYESEKAQVDAQRAQSAETAQSGLELNRAVAANRAMTEYQQAEEHGLEVLQNAFKNPDGTYRPNRGIDFLSQETSLGDHREIIKSLEEFQIAQDRAAPYSSQIAADLEAQQQIASRQQQAVDYRDNGDGTVTAKLETGEVFKGTPQQVITKIGEAKIATRRHFEAKERELLGQQQPANGQQQQQRQPVPVATGLDAEQYLREMTARAFNYDSADEMIQDYRQTKEDNRQSKEMYEQVRLTNVAAAFLNQCQDFPNTPEAIDAVQKICEENNWESANANNLESAHALAVRHGLYRPLSEEEIRASYAGPQQQQSSRPAPPPMIRSGSPDSQPKEDDLWSMPLDKLRKQALAQGKS